MKPLLYFFILFVFLNNNSDSTKSTQGSYVYICISKNAVAYHKSRTSCRGIKNCTHEIKKVTLYDALNRYHLRACKICY